MDCIRLILPAMLCVSLAGTAMAADNKSADNTFTLGAVTVSASRIATSDPPSLIVPAAELERFDYRRLDEALAVQPGLTLTPGGRGSARAEQRIYLRGFDGLQVPFLIDGIPFYVSWDGEPTDLSRFTTFDLAAIEVSKSYVPVASGPGALGGAINLVTRRPTRPFEGDFGIAYDADRNLDSNGYRAHANLGGRWGDWYAQFGASTLQSDGWRLPKDFAPAGPPVTAPLQGNRQPAGERLRSQSRDVKFSLKVGYAPNETDEYALAFYDQQGEKQVPPYAGSPNPNQRFNYFDWPQWDKQSFYFLSNTAWNAGLSLRTRLYYDRFQNSLNSYDNLSYSTQNTPRAFTSSYDDHAVGGSWVLGIPVGPGEISLAGHLRNDYHDDQQQTPARVPPVLKFEDRTWSLGAEYRWPLAEGWNAVIGVSRDSREARQAQDQNQAGASFDLKSQGATSLQGAVTWRVAAGSELYATVSRRGRFPSLFERYSYRLGSAIPNPGLKLERSSNYEVGYSGQVASTFNFSAAAFISELDDLIQPVTVSPGVVQNQNVGTARYCGVELSLKWAPSSILDLGVSYTWLDRESTTQPRRILFGTPENAAFAYVSWRPIQRLELAPSVEFATRRNTSDVVSAAGEPVGGYTLFNLRALLRLNDTYSLEVGLRNLTDRLYQLDYGYPAQGRNFSIMLRGRY